MEKTGGFFHVAFRIIRPNLNVPFPLGGDILAGIGIWGFPKLFQGKCRRIAGQSLQAAVQHRQAVGLALLVPGIVPNIADNLLVAYQGQRLLRVQIRRRVYPLFLEIVLQSCVLQIVHTQRQQIILLLTGASLRLYQRLAVIFRIRRHRDNRLIQPVLVISRAGHLRHLPDRFKICLPRFRGSGAHQVIGMLRKGGIGGAAQVHTE